jgi:hypothetical protein
VDAEGTGMPAYSESTWGQESVLDATLRAESLATSTGPAVHGAAELSAAWESVYAATPGVPAATGGAGSAAEFAAKRITRALKTLEADGVSDLQDLVPDLVAAGDVSTLRAWAATVEALAAKEPAGSVLELTAAAAGQVRDTPEVRPQGGAVTSLTRDPSLDASASVEATGFVSSSLARFGADTSERVGLAWRPEDAAEADTPQIAAPESWLAYRADDGTVYWLAGEDGKVALTDSSLLGWGYRTSSASLVDAGDIRRVLATFPAAGR